MSRRGLVIRLLLAGALLAALLGSPGLRLLEVALPLQRSVFAALLPDFDVLAFELAQRGAQRKLQSMTVNRRYIVMHGQAIRPGLVFDTQTPARTPLLLTGLLLTGAIIVSPLSRRAIVRSVLIALPACAAVLLVAAPIVLAGQQWSLGLDAFQEPSLPALWVALSQFLVYGGGFALCAATVWILAGPALSAGSIGRTAPAQPHRASQQGGQHAD
jgi:hypothetical protein